MPTVICGKSWLETGNPFVEVGHGQYQRYGEQVDNGIHGEGQPGGDRRDPVSVPSVVETTRQEQGEDAAEDLEPCKKALRLVHSETAYTEEQLDMFD